MTKEIPLSKGKTTLIDDEDYDLVSKYKWHAEKNECRWYARHSLNKFKQIKLHRFLLNPKPEEEIDHINGDGLDNRRCNLRIVTKSQNNMNRKKDRDSTSKYKGISWNINAKKWAICIKGIYLGSSSNEEDAARIYDEAAKKYFGEYARLNFPILKK